MKKMKTTSLMGFALALLGPGSALAQRMPMQANPRPGCTTTPAQLEATKKVALDFTAATGQAKLDMTGTSFKQHEPRYVKAAQEAKISDYEQVKKVFFSQAAAANANTGGPAANVPQPPAGNRMEIVVAQCDIVTVVRAVYRQDPTAAPGKFYEAFTFSAYRVKDGKVVEHWDDSVLDAPKTAEKGQ